MTIQLEITGGLAGSEILGALFFSWAYAFQDNNEVTWGEL